MEETENKKLLQVELKPEDRNLLKSAIEAMKPKEEKKPSKPEPRTEKHEHLTHDSIATFFEHNKDCPECKVEHDKLKKHFVKEALKGREDLENVCVECGTPVREEEENCPTCRGTEAKRRG